MLKPFVCTLLSLSLWGVSSLSYSQTSATIAPKTSQSEGPRLDLQRKGTTQQFTMKSKYTPNEYFIQVYIPYTPAPKTGYPVLYMLDGNAVFNSASSIAQSLGGGSEKMGLDPVVIVTIGYPSETQFSGQQRALDYTPLPKSDPQKDERYQYGGADNFLKFIQNELKPRIQQGIQINTQQQTLFGHSFGGLFTLDTFFKHPQSFNRYIAASPSLWFDQSVLTKELQQFKQKKTDFKTPILVMTTVGTAEGRGRPPRGSQPANTSSNFFEDFEALRSDQLKYWHFRHPAEQHITNMYASLPKAILFAACNGSENCSKLFNEN
ncbi:MULTISPECIES: alpha/beta hydrolase [unclassified Acinetobacter]|uniref:alpha/beta hydrolase n=1 Tax=unclassified Acinetobacter TaxID=196816 RepID=UPI00190D383B|nr:MULTISPECIES: alpha/beta hydrolase-fold protein [unclassified Acinetobacter]MBK0063824.1 alpha/beta hydrolase [Acinetobacter sp. S55]MBK0067108.1 alpha/beta hydrolase [Acinetobacter sp. S54]